LLLLLLIVAWWHLQRLQHRLQERLLHPHRTLRFPCRLHERLNVSACKVKLEVSATRRQQQQAAAYTAHSEVEMVPTHDSA
jgi:hypothetical protein